MKALHRISRRRILRGMAGGVAASVGLPYLDCFLDGNGTALASGAPLPTCFGTWFFGLGFNPGFWEPKTVGANFQPVGELAALAPYRSKINVYSGMKCFLDGKPLQVHVSGPQVGTGGGIARRGEAVPPSLDTIIADSIGTRTRFRSLEASCDGNPQSFSRRSGGAVNPSEISPADMYQRIFGPEFKDPNAADFAPDPLVLARRSALSVVADQRQALLRDLGTNDRARIDEYFTALRELEQQLDLQSQKPAPLESCAVPAKEAEARPGTVVDDALVNNRLFAQLFAHALACGQTRVFNIVFSAALSNLRKAGSADTHHILTHEEAVDEKLGYQPLVGWFNLQVVDGFLALVKALDGIHEGAGTLLDRTVVYVSSDTGYAKVHGLENMPMLTAGGAGGRMKTGIHYAANGDPVTRVGLTIQQALGVAASSWGTESNQTSKTITEVLA